MLLRTIFLSLFCLAAPLWAAPDPAPEFKVKDATGWTWSLADADKKPILIDLWATWCGPCIKAMPDLNRFYQAHRDKVDLLGLSVDLQGWAVVKPMIKRQGLQYPIALAPPGFSKELKVGNYPYMVLVHKGQVVKRFKGRHSYADLERELKPWLKG